MYGAERSSEDDLAAMRRAFGSWKDRDLDGAAWVDQLRSGTRLHQAARDRAGDAEVAEEAGSLGRRWLPSHHPIDSAGLAIAATAIRIGARLLTRNVRDFPMFEDLNERY